MFDEAGVPAEVAVDTVDGELALFDGDNERLGLVADVAHPTLGRIRQFGSLVHFSSSPEPTFTAPPMAGEHTREVLLRHGFTADEVQALLDDGVIAEPADDYGWSV